MWIFPLKRLIMQSYSKDALQGKNQFIEILYPLETFKQSSESKTSKNAQFAQLYHTTIYKRRKSNPIFPKVTLYAEPFPSSFSPSRRGLCQLLFWGNLRLTEWAVCVSIGVRGVPPARVWQWRYHLRQRVWAARAGLHSAGRHPSCQSGRVQ